MALQIGQKAPNFTLPNTKKEPVALESFKGKKVVLVFFPGAFTGVCTKEMCTFRDSLAAYNAMNAQVVGICVDPPATLTGFGDANKLTFPLLSDYKREVVNAYDVLQQNFAGLEGLTSSKRAVFVLDKEGVIRHIQVTANPGVEPNYDDVKKAVESIG